MWDQENDEDLELDEDYLSALSSLVDSGGDSGGFEPLEVDAAVDGPQVDTQKELPPSPFGLGLMAQRASCRRLQGKDPKMLLKVSWMDRQQRATRLVWKGEKD